MISLLEMFTVNTLDLYVGVLSRMLVFHGSSLGYGRKQLRIFSTEERPFRLLRARSRAGTPRYMSPEQIRGERVDVRSDIYSLGVCMYELFTGKLPYEGEKRKDVMKMHISRKVKPELPHKINPKVPPSLSRNIMTALEKDPAKRFQSIAELQVALKHVSVSRI